MSTHKMFDRNSNPVTVNVPERNRKRVLADVKKMNQVGRMLFGYDELIAFDRKQKK